MGHQILKLEHIQDYIEGPEERAQIIPQHKDILWKSAHKENTGID
jgi:hypothetical protein